MPELPPPPALPAVEPWRRLAPLLASWRSRVSPLAAALGGIVAIAVLGAVGWSAWHTGATGPPPELSMPRAGSAGDPSAAGSTTLPGSGAGSEGAAVDSRAPAAGSAVLVHVAGAVQRPGLYRLAPAPRVADAIDAAGGVTAEASLDGVNLAAKVVDGERVYVPRTGEVVPTELGSAAPSGTAASGPVDLNAATAEQLDGLPGVGPATAEAIIEYRQQHGRFRSVDELLDVRGIGDAKLAALRPKVVVR